MVLAVVFWQQRDKSKANAGTIEQRRLGILVTRYSKAGKIWSCLLQHGTPFEKAIPGTTLQMRELAHTRVDFQRRAKMSAQDSIYFNRLNNIGIVV
jgi:hypothetical protein